MFFAILISIVTLEHIYVFWRITSVPFVKRLFPKKYVVIYGVFLWGLFVAGLIYGHNGTGNITRWLEFLAMNWMAALFLIFASLLAVDCITVFGVVMSKLAPGLRGGAIIIGIIFSIIALIQGLRAPVIQNYEVEIPGLPPEMNGTVVVAMSDLHLGSLLNKQWLAKRITQVQEEHPDLVFLLGDTFEGHGPPLDELLPVLSRLSAPLGVWAVNGNHERYGNYKSDSLLRDAGIKLLQDNWAEISPGLVVVGLKDRTARRRSGKVSNIISKILKSSPPGATILLSHAPQQYGQAAKNGVALMLSGHTHGGQIWPFNYLVKQFYPLFEGKYEVEDMALIVCRGTGTWGPRMRLWRPSEILRIKLLSP